MKKFLKWTGITLLVLFIFLLLAPFLFKGKIMEAVKEAANDNLNARVNFTDVDLSLIRNFPNLRVIIEKITIDNIAPFDSVRLADIGSLELVVDIKSVFGDVIQVHRVGVVDPIFDVRVLRDGTANWDIMKADSLAEEEVSPQDSAGFKMELDGYFLKNAKLSYDDQSLPYSLYLEGLDHKGSGDFTDEQFTLETNTTIEKATTSYDGITYVKNANVELKMNLDIENKETMKITFADNEIRLNELFLAVNGWFAMPPDESYDMDISYSATKTDFRNLLSMVPAEFASDLKGVDVSGKMAFDGYVRGKYSEKSMPGFGVNLLVENGRFKYPDLPKSVENIQVKATIDAADGNDYDKMKIDVDKCHIEMAQNPVDMTLKLRTPMSDPDIDMNLKALVDLNQVREFIPLEENEQITGRIDADVQLKGKMSAVEQERYDDFYAAGNVNVADLIYNTNAMETDFQLSEAAMTFTPAYIDLSTFRSKIGRSDIALSGKLDNYLAYALKDSLLSGKLSLTSQLLDLNEFMTDEEETPADTSSMSVLELPRNIDFVMNADIAKMLYDDVEISNVKGGVVLRDAVASLENLVMNVLGGTASMTGKYNAQNLSTPSMDFTFDVQDMDINETAVKFNTVEKLAPIAKSCTGKFSARFDLATLLDQQMSPVTPTVNGRGNFKTSALTISGFKPLVKIAEVTQIEQLKSQLVKDVNLTFKIIEGLVSVEPFTVKLEGMPATIWGTTTIEGQIDYNMDMDIPFEKFPPGIINQANSIVAMANKSLGTNFSAGTKLPVKLKITGTIQDPKVGTNYGTVGGGDIKDQVVAEIKEEAKEQLNEAREKAIAEAIKQKEKLVAEAQKQADNLLAVAQTQADKIKKEAETIAKKGKDETYKQAQKLQDDAKGNPLKAAGAKLAADQLRKEADATFAKAMEEASKKADAPVVEARKQGDKLVKEAEAQGDKLIENANKEGESGINKIK